MLWNGDSPFVVIDVESNGLYGQPFCVGAVFMDPGGRVLADFISRCPLDEVPEDIVEKTIVPALDKDGIHQDASSFQVLKDRFIDWHLSVTNPEGASAWTPPPVWADVSFPVDVHFLRLMHTPSDLGVDGDMKRGWTPPFPLLDVATLIAATGRDPLVERRLYASELIGVREGMNHDPRWDAELSGLCVITAKRILETSRST